MIKSFFGNSRDAQPCRVLTCLKSISGKCGPEEEDIGSFVEFYFELS